MSKSSERNPWVIVSKENREVSSKRRPTENSVRWREKKEVTSMKSSKKAFFLRYYLSMKKHPFVAMSIALTFFFIEYAIFRHGFFAWQSDPEQALLLAGAFGGATSISLALTLSGVFLLRPSWGDQYWRIRRYCGVSGTSMILVHVFAAIVFYAGGDIRLLYPSLNPFQNPVVFGAIALPIFMVMASTSTDWAYDKLTPRRWKFIHRFVYIAYPSAVFHYLTMNPGYLKSLPGVVLLTLTTTAFAGALYGFVRHIRKDGFDLGTKIGSVILLGILTTAVLLFSK